MSTKLQNELNPSKKIKFNNKGIQDYKKLIYDVLLKFVPIKCTEKDLVPCNYNKISSSKIGNSSVFKIDDYIYFRRSKDDQVLIKLYCHGIELDTRLLSSMNEKAVKIYNYYKLNELYNDAESNTLSIDAIYKMIIDETILLNLTSMLSEGSSNARGLLSKIFENFYNMISDTYEGNQTTEVIIINSNFTDCNHGSKGISYCHKLDIKGLKPLINSRFSMVEVDFNGKIKKYKSIDNLDFKLNDNNITPYNYSFITNYLEKEISNKNSIAIVADEHGEILVYKHTELIFKFSQNMWHYISYLNFEAYLKKCYGELLTNLNNAKKLFNLLLDASFLRNGACIGIMSKEQYDDFLLKNPVNKYIQEWNLLVDAEFKNSKSALPQDVFQQYKQYRKEKINVIKKINKEWDFSKIDRVLYSELLALDGASIIVINNDKWEIKCVGTIISPSSQGESGGRLAAAKSLAHFGIGIKVSTDGGINLFYKGDVNLEYIIL